MSEYERKFAAAMAELEATDMWKSNHTPPVLRSLRSMGVQARPPHYAPFWSVVAIYALWFGVCWGALMWIFSWSEEDFTVLAAVGASAVAGVIFGVCMAIYYARGRKKHGLTAWDAL